jgi:calcium-dependent protein kinase
MGCGNSRSVSVDDKIKIEEIKYTKTEKIRENQLINHDHTPMDDFAIENHMLVDENKHSLSHSYKFLEKLGEGSYAKVFKVIHLITKELRAIKIIKKDYIKNKDDDNKTFKEIQILSMLDHPNIIKVYEYFTDAKYYYLVVELAQGGELYEQLYHIQFFSEREAAIIMDQILSAVCYLHSRGIVHRDLKPENLLLETDSKNSDLTIKLIDFGTSNFYNKTNKLNSMVGSIYYMAPEVINSNYNEKCDLWSCGVIMYILLSGNAPFEGQNEKEVIREIIKGKFSFNGPEWQDISVDARDLIKSLLTYKPEDRISAAEALQHPWIINHKTKEYNKNLPKLSVANFLENVSFKQKLHQMTIAYLVHQMSANENIKNLRSIFKRMDSSGDGRLSIDEIKAGYKQFFNHKFSDQECDQILKELDKDRSGYIEFEEFLRATLKVETIVTEQNLKMAFIFFDKDKSGKLSAEEIKIILGDKNDDNAHIKTIIDEVDTNKDGQISFEEFKNLMKKAIN